MHAGQSMAAQRQEGFAAALDREAEQIGEMVKSELRTWNPNDAVARALHSGNEAVTKVYGGREDIGPHELQVVEAWRPTPRGEWELAKGVVHRVHHEGGTLSVTVQFVDNQHRCRLPWVSCKPMLDITPEYPTVRLAPGERLPSRAEILRREHNANVMREMYGLAPDAPLPSDEDSLHLRPEEALGENGKPVILSDKWGIPAPTLDALRNRSVPGCQLTGVYGAHYYSNLYKNNFYPSAARTVTDAGRVGVNAGLAPQQPRVVGHRYVPLQGPELQQDLSTGQWIVADTSAPVL